MCLLKCPTGRCGKEGRWIDRRGTCFVLGWVLGGENAECGARVVGGRGICFNDDAEQWRGEGDGLQRKARLGGFASLALGVLGIGAAWWWSGKMLSEEKGKLAG